LGGEPAILRAHRRTTQAISRLDEFGAQGQWDEKYVPDYLEISAHYADVIKGHLFGHVHASGLRAFPDDRVQTPLVTASAVSPIYNNYPTYFVASYSRKSGLCKGLSILSVCAHHMGQLLTVLGQLS
jgi:hypothetical protein